MLLKTQKHSYFAIPPCFQFSPVSSFSVFFIASSETPEKYFYFSFLTALFSTFKEVCAQQ